MLTRNKQKYLEFTFCTKSLFFFTGKLVYVLRLYFIETTFLFLVPSKKFDWKFDYISYLYYLILINFIIYWAFV